MIISHERKFIFIKTEKTAGTSIEIALSKYCGPDDVITPITPKDEELRRSLGYRGAQNFKIPFSRYSKLDFVRLAGTGVRRGFYNHMGAAEIRKYVDPAVWNSYFKFAFERNPWDKVISWYFWRHRSEPRPSLSEFVQSREANLLKGFELYTQDAELAVDRVFQYGQLDDAMAEISDLLQLGETPALPRAKSNFRSDKRSYRELLSEDDRAKIARVYAREIAYFGYEW